jgi:aminoglycoside 6'-N-acetyltransferase
MDKADNGSNAVVLRKAAAENALLLRIWDKTQHVIDATGADAGSDWNWESELLRNVAWREFLVGEVAGRAIGFVQIIDAREEETHYWGEVAPGLRAIDIWLGDVADFGKGYGSAMMRLALARCFADASVTAVLIDPLVSNTKAHPFYERLGFRRTGRQLFGEDDCFVYRMERSEWAASECRPAG